MTLQRSLLWIAFVGAFLAGDRDRALAVKCLLLNEGTGTANHCTHRGGRASRLTARSASTRYPAGRGKTVNVLGW